MSDALKEAMERLERISKSQDGTDGEPSLEQLVKALEAEVEIELMAKSKESGKEKDETHPEPDGDNMGGPSDGDEDNEDEEGKDKKKKEDTAMKSQSEDFGDELVKASEMYAELQKSVETGIGNVAGDIATLQKSQASLVKLSIGQANVIGALTKSVKDMMSLVGKQPTIPNKAVLGVGERDKDTGLKKSVSEISESLNKAVSEGKVPSAWLSIWGTYRDVDRFPEDVKTALGL